MDNALIIFIRNPEPGKVKTRLAAAVGDERALAIYRELLDLTRRAALGSEAEKYLWYSHFVDKADGWPESDFRKMLQQGEDLGDRMAYAFETVLADHGKAVIIGSDCPYLSPVLLDEAFEALDDSDFVIGPATDGGYYLLGMNRFVPEIFQGIEWSTDTVFRETVARIRQSGADYEVLPQLSDVDEIADWERFQGGRN
ncbi:MAG TPA: TIGR04282 family arsenosugar biosynthesis glycosyltransferase [Flavilitoribacter sp.]|nr:TIGR04282 family arsenosugar biosynthesis glycosyltransferase [Flavilitoribacter sp.]